MSLLKINTQNNKEQLTRVFFLSPCYLFSPLESGHVNGRMAPRRHILLLLCFSALFIFSLYNSSIPLPLRSSSSSSRFLSHPTPYSLTINLLAYDRFSSLSRCFRSLSAAHYGGDTVNLHIFVDHFKQQPNISDSRPASVDEKLENSRRILDFVDGFSWKFGEKLVHYRTVNVGLQAQWLEAWWPSSDDEFAFVVEDDLEVSPLYYEFLKGLIMNYYYNKSNFSPWIYGASLQRPRFVPEPELENFTAVSLLYKAKCYYCFGYAVAVVLSPCLDAPNFPSHQLVGTWGQLLFPKPWKEFRMWFDAHKAKGIKPYLDGMVTTGWYRKMGEDAGVNYGRTVGPDSTLLDDSSLDLNLLEMQPLINLKWYDFCFREVVPGRIVSKLDEPAHVLSSMRKEEPILLVSIFRTSEEVISNLLCHLERQNIRNYILLGSSDFLHGLARRGHPVVDTDRLFEDVVKSYHSSFRIEKLNSELTDQGDRGDVLRSKQVSGIWVRLLGCEWKQYAHYQQQSPT
ncbi:hypothetical protein Dimus_011816 [Dionaea muscipula]